MTAVPTRDGAVRGRLMLASGALLATAGLLVAGCGGGGGGEKAEPSVSAAPGVELPKDFPSADVPLVAGQLVAAAAQDGDWQLTVQAAKTGPFDAAVAALTDKGYIGDDATNAGGLQARRLIGPNGKDCTPGKAGCYTVEISVRAAASAGGNTVQYFVSRLS